MFCLSREDELSWSILLNDASEAPGAAVLFHLISSVGILTFHYII